MDVEQVISLEEFKDIAKDKCAVTTEKVGVYTVLELKPPCEYP